MPTKTTRVQVTLPIAIARRATELAEKDGRSLANYLQRVIEVALEAREAEAKPN